MMRMQQSTLPLVLSLVLGVANVQADKDNSYYMAGSGNPNVVYPMYWKDADDVLNDLDQFQGLYVQFHHCAWTMMQYPEGDDDDDVDESDLWYQNKVPPMGANVAFSLYGQLKGSKQYGCNKDTFIKSFYTTQGFTYFANAMYYAGVNGFSYSSYDDDQGGTESAKCNSGYGVGCTYTEGFAYLSYSSDQCNPSNATGVADTMQNLNYAMSNVQCTSIYDADQTTGYVYGTPLELLAYSRACMYQNFYSPEGECPDPYGVLAKYQKNFNNGIQLQTAADPYRQYQRLMEGRIMVVVGTIFFALAGALLLWDTRNVATAPWEKAILKKMNIRKGRKRRQEDTSTNDDNNNDDGAPYTEPMVELTETRKAATPASPEVPTGVERPLSPATSPEPKKETKPASPKKEMKPPSSPKKETKPASSPKKEMKPPSSPKMETKPASSPEKEVKPASPKKVTKPAVPKADGLMKAEAPLSPKRRGFLGKMRGIVRK